MQVENEKEAINLYRCGYSAKDISLKLGFGIKKAYSVLKKNGIPIRNAAENNKLQFLKKPATFYIKKRLSISEERLKVAGTMLYWAEGYKKNYVDFANSDSEMIKIFLKFLRDICRIDESKLKMYLYCHSNQDIGEIKKFWSELAGIPLAQFTKPYIKNGENDKINKMKHGLIHIRYYDKKLLDVIKNWIKKFING